VCRYQTISVNEAPQFGTLTELNEIHHDIDANDDVIDNGIISGRCCVAYGYHGVDYGLRVPRCGASGADYAYRLTRSSYLVVTRPYVRCLFRPRPRPRKTEIYEVLFITLSSTGTNRGASTKTGVRTRAIKTYRIELVEHPATRTP